MYNYKISMLLLLALVCLGCGGEVTTLDFGSAQEDSLETFGAEIQPIFSNQAQPTSPLNCSQASFCHAPPLGQGGFTFYPEPDQMQLIDNHNAVLEFINRNDPDASRILFAPLPAEQGGRQGHPTSYPNKQDCCYQKIRAWIASESLPDCQCPAP